MVKANNAERDTVNAVFMVQGSKRAFVDAGTVCHVEYVTLRNGLTRGAALPIITKQVKEYHGTSRVQFHFWADSYLGTGPSPAQITGATGGRKAAANMTKAQRVARARKAAAVRYNKVPQAARKEVHNDGR